MAFLRVRLRIDFDNGAALGPGKIDLLEQVARTGSLSGAARALKMSYRRAWLLLHSVNEGFDEPAVELSVGGRQGGGAELTAFGTELVYAYRHLETELQGQSVQRFARIAQHRVPAKIATSHKTRPLSRKPPGAKRSKSSAR